MDKSQFTVGVFLDLSKAFDVVPHDILMKKLNNYGIRGKAHDLIKSYLDNRKQYVDISGSKSTYLKITSGVPQGSILGSTLFLIYVNAIYKFSTSKLIMYADDINLIYSGSSLYEIIYNTNNDLTQLHNWFNSNKLRINIKKSNYLIFHSPQHKILLNTPPILYNNNILTRSSFTKFLGIFLDDKMSWKIQINNVCKQIAIGLGFVSKIRQYFPYYVVKHICTSFIESYLTYGIESWGTACKTTLNPLYTLQKRALRIIHSLPPSSSVSEIFPTDGILTLRQLAYYKLAVLFHGVIHNSRDICGIRIVSVDRGITSRAASKGMLSLIKVKTNYGKQKFEYIGCKIWNDLEASVKMAKSLPTFKTKLKTHVICSDSNIYQLLGS